MPAPPLSPIYETYSLNVAPVAAKTLATLSVLGQRRLPSAVTRLLLLNVVGSRPNRLTKPEAENLYSDAIRSIARHTSA